MNSSRSNPLNKVLNDLTFDMWRERLKEKTDLEKAFFNLFENSENITINQLEATGDNIKLVPTNEVFSPARIQTVEDDNKNMTRMYYQITLQSHNHLTIIYYPWDSRFQIWFRKSENYEMVEIAEETTTYCYFQNDPERDDNAVRIEYNNHSEVVQHLTDVLGNITITVLENEARPFYPGVISLNAREPDETVEWHHLFPAKLNCIILNPEQGDK